MDSASEAEHAPVVVFVFLSEIVQLCLIYILNPSVFLKNL